MANKMASDGIGTNIEKGGILDPVQVGEKPKSRRTKGTPFTNGGTGFNLQFDYLPPGEDIGNQAMGMDSQRVIDLAPRSPIVTSADNFSKK